MGTTLLITPHCMEELQDFNDFCGWLEEMIEGDEVSCAQLQNKKNNEKVVYLIICDR